MTVPCLRAPIPLDQLAVQPSKQHRALPLKRPMSVSNMTTESESDYLQVYGTSPWKPRMCRGRSIYIESGDHSLMASGGGG